MAGDVSPVAMFQTKTIEYFCFSRIKLRMIIPGDDEFNAVDVNLQGLFFKLELIESVIQHDPPVPIT